MTSATPSTGGSRVHLKQDTGTFPLYLSSGMDWGLTLSDYAVHQRAAGLSDKTIRNRSECLTLVARISRKGPDAVTVDDLERVLARTHPRTGRPLAPGTKQSERSYLQAFFRWMKKTKRRKDNPAKDLPKVKVPRRQPRPLRVDQIEAMLGCGVYSRTRDIITIAALTGLRLGEVVKIRGEDVDLTGRTIQSVRKGNLDHRIGLPEALVPLAQRMPREGWWFPSPQRNSEFPNGGGHILMKSASDRISKAIRAAGITDRRITGHSLRHFLATELLRDGVPIRVVQEMLGHASLATTQLYAGVTEDEVRDGMNHAPPLRLPHKSGRRMEVKSATIAA